jgi:GNAT superfamily N-acetyltransferase
MSDVDQLMERTQWDLFFVPPDTRIVDRPELLYCATPRDINHLNSVVRTRLDDTNRDAAIEEVRAAHSGVTSEWLVHDWLGNEALGPALTRYGYRPAVEHRAYVASTDLELQANDRVAIRRVDTLEALRDGEAVFRRAFGLDREIIEQHEHQQLADCVDPKGRVHRFVVYEHGEPVSGGAMTFFPALGFAMLWRGGTIPEARGRGLYKAVLRERMKFAKRHGIALVGLYAKLATSAPIVARLGFEGHGMMTFWHRESR